MSSDNFKIGDLKSRLMSIPLLRFDSSLIVTPPSGLRTFRLRLKNLNKTLDYFIGCAIIRRDQTPFRPADGLGAEGSDYPTNPGLMQLIPKSNFTGSAPQGYFRPVFQDPTNVLNENAPLPQTIPFSWNAPAETDELELGVSVNLASYADSGVDGTLYAQAMVEYTGEWWDISAIKYAISQVQFEGPTRVEVVGTTNAPG